MVRPVVLTEVAPLVAARVVPREELAVGVRLAHGLAVLRGLDLVDEAGAVAAAALVRHAGAARLEVVVDVGPDRR